MKQFFAVLVILVAAEATRADWPLFRGNALQNGIADSTLSDKLDILWKIQVKDGIEGTAAIVKDSVYFGSFDGHVYAVDLADGKAKWKYTTGAGVKAPPSVFAGTVYVGDEDGIFHAIDSQTGVKRWTFETGGEITGGANFAGDHVVFGSHDSTLYCLAQ